MLPRSNWLRGAIALAALALAVRAYLVLNLPITIWPGATHDDGHFIGQAITIVTHAWFGPFNQYTLMKGPGYSWLVAGAAISGFSVSAVHMALQCGAIALTGYVAGRLTRSPLIGVLLVIALALDPSGLAGEARRVVRDQIYWAQSLLVFSSIAFALMPLGGRRSRWAIAAGVLLAWTFLTREEGVWLLPGIAILIGGAFLLHSTGTGGRRHVLIAATLGAVVFAACCGGFVLVNRAVYGSFVGVDFVESRFQDAVTALQRIDVGDPVEYVPVSAAALSAAADVSPAFAPMAELLMPTGTIGSGWGVHGCAVYPHTCGNIAGGWFAWALRDAAAALGYYDSPASASDAFARVASELGTACDTGALKCAARSLPLLPRIGPPALQRLPDSMLRAAALVSLATRPSYEAPASGLVLNDDFFPIWAFLNFPYLTPVTPRDGEYRISGWYRSAESGAPEFIARSKIRSWSLTPVLSPAPDVAEFLVAQPGQVGRFQVESSCETSCALDIRDPSGAIVSVEMATNSAVSLHDGAFLVHVDEITEATTPDVFLPERRSLSLGVTNILDTLMAGTKPAALGIGLLAYIIAAGLHLSRRYGSAALVLATAAWVLVATRIALLALIDVTSFPSINFLYGLPASYLSWVAAILSVAAAILRPEVGLRTGDDSSAPADQDEVARPAGKSH